eukprot:1391457-Amphidinium_carterae.2
MPEATVTATSPESPSIFWAAPNYIINCRAKRSSPTSGMWRSPTLHTRAAKITGCRAQDTAYRARLQSHNYEE